MILLLFETLETLYNNTVEVCNQLLVFLQILNRIYICIISVKYMGAIFHLKTLVYGCFIYIMHLVYIISIGVGSSKPYLKSAILKFNYQLWIIKVQLANLDYINRSPFMICFDEDGLVGTYKVIVINMIKIFIRSTTNTNIPMYSHTWLCFLDIDRDVEMEARLWRWFAACGLFFWLIFF